MKTRKKGLPKFKDADEELRYIETHDATEYIDSLPKAPMFQLAPEEKERIAARSRLKMVSIRLREEQLAAIKQIAKDKDIPYQIMIRSVINDFIQKQQ